MRRTKSRFAFALCSTLLAPGVAHAAVWGSFDASRINYVDGPLSGAAHSKLRSIILEQGDTVAPETAALTADYLGTVDVFYTSLLDTFTGPLAESEQSALGAWLSGGGTLIVTADIFPPTAYESFTASYGVTGYVDAGGSSPATVVAMHPITAGVTHIAFETNVSFTYPASALLLAEADAQPFGVVMEPATGFDAGGRILVWGDHNAFTDAYIDSDDNTTLAKNVAAWASKGCTTDADCEVDDPCGGTAACVNGLCTAKGETSCDDMNPCTDDACDPVAGCTHTPNSAPCDDGDACTQGDVCQMGTCTGGDAVECPTGGTGGEEPSAPSGGCDCRAGSESSEGALPGMLALLALASLRRRHAARR